MPVVLMMAVSCGSSNISGQDSGQDTANDACERLCEGAAACGDVVVVADCTANCIANIDMRASGAAEGDACEEALVTFASCIADLRCRTLGDFGREFEGGGGFDIPDHSSPFCTEEADDAFDFCDL